MSSLSPFSDGYELLCEALKHRRTEQVKLLLAKGYSEVNCSSESVCDTPLHLAVRNGNAEVVKLLLSKNADVHAKGRNGRIPLHLAAANGNEEIAGLLLDSGSEPDSRDGDGIAPLHIASERGCIPIIHELLKNGASVNLRSKSSVYDSYTALHHASENGHEKVVVFLLAHGADVDAKEKYGTTALHFSSEKGFNLIVKELLNHKASVNLACTSGWRKGYTPLHHASEELHECIVEMLLEVGAVVNVVSGNQSTPLHLSLQYGDGKIALMLLEHGADVNAKDKDGKTALYHAARNGYSVIVAGILKSRPDVDDKYNKLALHSAIKEPCGKHGNYKEIVENLMKYGFTLKPEDAKNYNLLLSCVENGYSKILENLLQYGAAKYTYASGKWKKGFTLLHNAAYNGRLDIAKLLIRYGANVNAKDRDGRTPICNALYRDDSLMIEMLLKNGANVRGISEPLHLAVNNGRLEVVEDLLKYGADIDSLDDIGLTPLLVAVSRGKEEIAKFLISKGADINTSKRNNKRTALHDVAFEGCNNLVKLLLEYDACVDSRDAIGMPPVFYAALNGHVDTVNTFLEFGVDINCTDNFGRTILHVASRSGCVEVVELMLEHCADLNATDKEGRTPINIAIGGINSDPALLHIDIFRNVNYTFSKYDETVELYIKYMTKIKALNLYLCDSNLLILAELPYSVLHRKCEEEIEKMKCDKAGDRISFFDILTKQVNEIAMYLRNENIKHAMELKDYKTQYPIYSRMLERQFVRGEVRSRLLHSCATKLDYFFESVLPHPVTQKILNYLSEKDMKIFINEF